MGNKGSMNNEEGTIGKKVGVLNRGGDEVRKVKARGVLSPDELYRLLFVAISRASDKVVFFIK